VVPDPGVLSTRMGLLCILRTERQANRATGRGVAHGIFKQIFDNPLYHGDVGLYERQTGIEVDFYAELLFFGRQIKFLYHVMGQIAVKFLNGLLLIHIRGNLGQDDNGHPQQAKQSQQSDGGL
jgi:hypothetical protein